MDKKVILISIDGLRPDAVETCGHPFVNTLRENGCYSPDASSVVPPVTLPAHTSIFYSVPPIRHGIITNDLHAAGTTDPRTGRTAGACG